MRVLLVEDDTRFADALARSLRRRGYDVLHVATGAAALDAPEVDLVLLDLGLPDSDGADLCRKLRARSDTACIAVTARGEVWQRVNGLHSGFDDYLVKPVAIAELLARMEAVLRRVKPRPAGAMRIGRLEVDLDAHRVIRDGSEIALTLKEFALLATLSRDAGAVVSRERLMLEVWQSTWRGGRTLDVHVASLRAKLGTPSLIETVRGVGYRLIGAAEPASPPTAETPAALCDDASSSRT